MRWSAPAASGVAGSGILYTAPVAGLVRMQFAGAVLLLSGARMEASFTKFRANKAVVCLALRSSCNQLCFACDG